MQGILLTRHCQIKLISILKENPKEEEQADSWAEYVVAIAEVPTTSKTNENDPWEEYFVQKILFEIIAEVSHLSPVYQDCIYLKY